MNTLDTAEAAGRQLKALRRRSGMSQQQLAERAGVSRKFVVDFEAGHDGAELGRSLQLMHAAGLSIYSDAPSQDLQDVFDSATRAMAEEIARGDNEYALRLLGKAIAPIHHGPAAEVRNLMQPEAKLPTKWDRLLRASTAYAMRSRGVTPADWTKTPRLRSPWFPAMPATDRYAELTRRQTPEDLAKVNIYLRERTLAPA